MTTERSESLTDPAARAGAAFGAAATPRPAGEKLVARSRWLVKYQRLLIGTDAVVVFGAVFLAQVFRFGTSNARVSGPLQFGYSSLSVLIALTWLGTLWWCKSRDGKVIGTGSEEYKRVTSATMRTFGLLAIVSLLGKYDFGRLYLAVAFPLGGVLLLLGRLFWRRWLQGKRERERCLTRALVVGQPADAYRVFEELKQNRLAGFRPIGIAIARASSSADPDGRAAAPLPGGSTTVGDIGQVVELVAATGSSAVIVAGDLPEGPGQLRDLGWKLENLATDLILVAKLTDVAGPRIHLRPVNGLPMMHVDLPEFSGSKHVAKRVFDIVTAGLALILLSPLMLAVTILIKADGPGPIVFRQERIGLRGRPFMMWKFRSMVVDAELDLERVLDGERGFGIFYKAKDDPRVTRIGRFIRRYSVDELPQLVNVIRGDMTMVGPRPQIAKEVELYRGSIGRRLHVKPGITGLWQVSGRSNLGPEESIKLDLYYVENWSFVTDLLIMVKTVGAVLKSDGAY